MAKLLIAICLSIALIGASAAITAVPCTWTAGALTSTLCQDVSTPSKCYTIEATLYFWTCSSDGTNISGVTARPGYFLGTDKKVAASPCMTGCAVCTANTFVGCTTVMEGYVAKADSSGYHQCITGAKGCVAATYDTVASACMDGYFQTPSSGDITACTPCKDGCKTCTDAEFATCSAAQDGWFITKTDNVVTAITACDNAFATVCSAAGATGKDTTCKPGYGLATGTCAACADNCADCGADKTKCTAVSEGFYLDISTWTPSATPHANCKTAKKENHAFCLTCDDTLFRGIYTNAAVVADATAVPAIAAKDAYDSCECQENYLLSATDGLCKAAKTPTATCKKGKKNCKTCWSKPSSKTIKSNKTKIPSLKTKWKKMCKTPKAGYAIFKKTGAIYKIATTKIGAPTPAPVTPAARVLAASSNILAMTIAVIFSLAVILF